MMLSALEAVARPGEIPDGTNRQAIERWASGRNCPKPPMQALFERATEGAVRPQDWVDLHTGQALPAVDLDAA